jgi:putative ABC transport system permease protein
MRGRDFSYRDTATAPGVVIINETMARRFWPAEEAVGRHLKFGGAQSKSPWLTIVGVVRDVRQFGLDSQFLPHMYRPYSQAAWPGMTVVARTTGNPALLASQIRKAAGEIDPEQPVSNVLLMEQVVTDSLGGRRFPMLLLATFAIVALVLAAVGIYGVMSYTVTMRTREIGIRMALGAGASEVMRSVVIRSMGPVVIGMVAGLAGAAALTRVLANLLYGVSPTDPTVLGSVSALLMLVALAASAVPARKASRVDPMVALRHE